jgi:hypothetical protein
MSVAYSTQFKINRLPHDDDELWWTVFALFGYRIPRVSVCPGHTAPFTAFADAYFARYPSMVWKASRGLGGKSRTLAVLGLTEAVLLSVEVTVLGGSFAQSKNVHDATKEAWDWHAAPRHLIERSNQYDTILHKTSPGALKGGHLRTLTASQTSVRGPHPPRLRMDEIDEMDQNILDAALGQPMEQVGVNGFVIPTQTVMSSTHQYPDKAMSEMIKRARAAGHPVYEWCYRETSNPTDGWLTPQAIERARSVVSQYMWETEYDLQEPSFAGRAIDTDSVERAFNPDWGTFNGDSMVATPKQEGRHYLTAVDWAKHRDQTIITTFDTTEHPWRCVAWQKVQHLPWPLLVGKAVQQWRVYGDRFVHDRTGVGEFAHDEVRAQVSTGEFAKVTGVVMGGGRDRDALYNDYIAAIEHDDIRYPRITWAYDEHKYVTPDALFTSKEHAPDSVVAGALAWSQRKRSVGVAGPGGGRRASSPWEV